MKKPMMKKSTKAEKGKASGAMKKGVGGGAGFGKASGAMKTTAKHGGKGKY